MKVIKEVHILQNRIICSKTELNSNRDEFCLYILIEYS